MSSTAVVPPEQWGKDHWSTFAYIAHWCVQYGEKGFAVSGRRHRRQMRVDSEIHPFLAHLPGHCPPTILRAGTRERHDDYSCADDMEAAGLIRWEGTGANPVFYMTDLGLEVAAALNAHKTEGGTFATFHFEPGGEWS